MMRDTAIAVAQRITTSMGALLVGVVEFTPEFEHTIEQLIVAGILIAIDPFLGYFKKRR